MGSHPMRVRGLKQEKEINLVSLTESHPMRVRGLKPKSKLKEDMFEMVAPHAGAWIETWMLKGPQQSPLCRTPCGCVD